MYNFKGFTQKANEALNLAISCAGELGQTYIGSEHIVLGILRQKDNAAAVVLRNLGVDAELYERTIRENTATDDPCELTAEDLTPRSKRILQVAMIQAARLRHNYVGTEHLLIAVLGESDCYAVRFLSMLGVRAQNIFDELGKIVNGSEKAAPGGRKPEASPERAGGEEKNTLEQFGTDLTQMAKSGEIDPVIGRKEEIERVIQILSRRTKNNPCLIGEPGVGKTAVAQGLALKIAEGEVPETLKDKRIISLDLTGMVAGTKYRGDFEERIKSAMDEVKNSRDIILFIDELHTIIGAGSAEGSTDAANILKPALARGDFQVIGATTINEYRKYIEKDAALERRFQPVNVDEPTEDEAIEILKGLRDRYEAHHKGKITDAALDAAVELSARYIADRLLPDKAIDLIDEAASRVRLRNFTAPDSVKELEEKIKKADQEKSAAISTQDFERAAKLRDEGKRLHEQLEKAKEEWNSKTSHNNTEVTPEDIAQIVSMWTGVPVSQLTEEESQRLLRLEDTLHQRIVGQEEAVSAVARAIRRGRVGLKDPKRPTGSFIFCGPTGVGKTELCKALAEAMFGDEEAMIRLDMSEYMEKHTVSRLVGSPPGYVGYDEGGQLTEAVRRKPYSVILFDEIEKAHPDVFNMLLQILEDGRLTDSQGRVVNFKNTVIIMTSNVGARLITEKHQSLGFSAGEDSVSDYKTICALVTEELKRVFRPEFLNRVDDIIVFHKLSDENIRNIAEKMLVSLKKRLEELQVTITFDESAIAAIAKAGYDPVYGARPLRREISARLEDAISEKILEGGVQAGETVLCTYEDGSYRFTPAAEETEIP